MDGCGQPRPRRVPATRRARRRRQHGLPRRLGPRRVPAEGRRRRAQPPPPRSVGGRRGDLPLPRGRGRGPNASAQHGVAAQRRRARPRLHAVAPRRTVQPRAHRHIPPRRGASGDLICVVDRLESIALHFRAYRSRRRHLNLSSLLRRSASTSTSRASRGTRRCTSRPSSTTPPSLRCCSRAARVPTCSHAMRRPRESSRRRGRSATRAPHTDGMLTAARSTPSPTQQALSAALIELAFGSDVAGALARSDGGHARALRQIRRRRKAAGEAAARCASPARPASPAARTDAYAEPRRPSAAVAGCGVRRAVQRWRCGPGGGGPGPATARAPSLGGPAPARALHAPVVRRARPVWSSELRRVRAPGVVSNPCMRSLRHPSSPASRPCARS